mgnify:CR=1 FL=1
MVITRNYWQASHANLDLLPQTEIPDTMLEEIHLVLPPNTDIDEIIQFTNQIEEKLQPHILRVVGVWSECTVVMVILSRAICLAEIMSKLRQIDGISATEETPLRWENSPTLIKGIPTILSTKSHPGRSIFIDF